MADDTVSISNALELFRTLEEGEERLAEQDVRLEEKRQELEALEQQIQQAEASHNAMEAHTDELRAELAALRAGVAEAQRQAQAAMEPLLAEVLALRKERDGLQFGMMELHARMRELKEGCAALESRYRQLGKLVKEPPTVASSQGAWPSTFEREG